MHKHYARCFLHKIIRQLLTAVSVRGYHWYVPFINYINQNTHGQYAIFLLLLIFDNFVRDFSSDVTCVLCSMKCTLTICCPRYDLEQIKNLSKIYKTVNPSDKHNLNNSNHKILKSNFSGRIFDFRKNVCFFVLVMLSSNLFDSISV